MDSTIVIGNEDFVQEVIHENEKIYELIKDKLSNAKSEILIASSWFTDQDLFDIVIERIKSNIDVNIIIADNADNEKLPFHIINELGGFCIKIKSVGFGMMHQKFCVVDKCYAIHGSYNYTVNARKNNHESVIYTTYKDTVQDLVNTFNIIKSRAIAIKEGLSVADKSKPELLDVKEVDLRDNLLENKISMETKVTNYEKVLSTLIEAEINHFDRNELYQSGYTRSESCSGDFNTLYNSLDTIYYNFIKDIDISAEQKKTLLVKINEHKSRSLQILDFELAQKQNIIKIDSDTNKESYSRLIKENKVENEKNAKRIENIRNIEVETIKKKISGHKTKINESKQEYIKPKLKLFEFIPLAISNFILFLYLILFYSSAGYILIYSKVDIHNSIKKGLEIVPPGIFEPNALQYAFKHGFTALFFVLLFSFVPIVFNLTNRLITNKMTRSILYVVGLFVIDFFVAILISKSIQDAKNLINETNVHWNWGLAFSDINFYLVFVLGAMPLFIFKFSYDKLIQSFSERNPTVQAQKNVIDIDFKEREILQLEQEINIFEKDIEKIQFNILEYKKMIEENEYRLDYLPSNEIRELEKVQIEFNATKQHFEHIASMYINKVETNNPRISIDALKDRISTFMEGWNDFLHRYFSYIIAIDKSSKAIEVITNWLTLKLDDNQFDSRINR